MQVYLKQRLPAHCTHTCVVFLQFMVFQFSQPAISLSNSENKSKCSSVDLIYTHLTWNLCWHFCIAIFVTASFKGKTRSTELCFYCSCALNHNLWILSTFCRFSTLALSANQSAPCWARPIRDEEGGGKPFIQEFIQGGLQSTAFSVENL